MQAGERIPARWAINDTWIKGAELIQFQPAPERRLAICRLAVKSPRKSQAPIALDAMSDCSSSSSSIAAHLTAQPRAACGGGNAWGS